MRALRRFGEHGAEVGRARRPNGSGRAIDGPRAAEGLHGIAPTGRPRARSWGRRSPVAPCGSAIRFCSMKVCHSSRGTRRTCLIARSSSTAFSTAMQSAPSALRSWTRVVEMPSPYERIIAWPGVGMTARRPERQRRRHRPVPRPHRSGKRDADRSESLDVGRDGVEPEIERLLRVGRCVNEAGGRGKAGRELHGAERRVLIGERAPALEGRSEG